jgi:hypothetical protein
MKPMRASIESGRDDSRISERDPCWQYSVMRQSGSGTIPRNWFSEVKNKTGGSENTSESSRARAGESKGVPNLDHVLVGSHRSHNFRLCLELGDRSWTEVCHVFELLDSHYPCPDKSALNQNKNKNKERFKPIEAR